MGRGKDGLVASLIASVLPEGQKGPSQEVRLGAGAAHLSSPLDTLDPREPRHLEEGQRVSRHDLKLLSPKHQAKFKPSHLSVHKHHEGFPGGTVVKSRLPMQETWVRSLIRKDPTYCRATKPVRHSRRAGALEPGSRNYGALALDLQEPESPRA